MAARSTTSEFQPSPPFARIRAKNQGQPTGAINLHQNTPTRAMNPGPNMCCAPTGGTTTGKSIRPKAG